MAETMPVSTLAVLLCRCLAIYAWLQIIPHVGYIFDILFGISTGSIQGETSRELFMCSVVVPQVVLLLCGIGLWRGAEALARRMVCRHEQEKPVDGVGGLTYEQWMSIVLSALGVYITVTGISELSYRVWGLTRIASGWAMLFASALKLVLGLTLFMGSQGVARLAAKLRSKWPPV
jgi:hypothetical protein